MSGTAPTTNLRTGETTGHVLHPMTGRRYFVRTAHKDAGNRDRWANHVWSPDSGIWHSEITPLDGEGKPMLFRIVATADFASRAAAFDAALNLIEADARLDMH